MPYVWRWILVTAALFLVIYLLLSSNRERYDAQSNSAILGTWVSADQKMRLTFTDDRGKVTIEESGKDKQTAYYVMNESKLNHGSAASGIDKKWTFSVTNAMLTWQNEAGQSTIFKKVG